MFQAKDVVAIDAIVAPAAGGKYWLQTPVAGKIIDVAVLEHGQPLLVGERIARIHSNDDEILDIVSPQSGTFGYICCKVDTHVDDCDALLNFIPDKEQ